MKNKLTILLLLGSLSLFSQSRKASNTYAIVVGISDYQHPSIPDLQFAHVDAEKFAQFLQTEGGGKVQIENIKLLQNENATVGKIIAAMDWLMEVSKEGDNAVIYFSGHGDVETKTRRQMGFLLAWDTPPQSYMAGAFPLFYLEQIIQTISLDNKARVLLVADACRSGNLAGSQIGGASLTTANLATQFANEIKILSCQPEEYSLEGEQWGGGRGVFSYHLMDGLFGKADKDDNGEVNLMEIGRYLEDHVTSDAAPHSQMPMTVGNRLEEVSYVFEEALASIEQQITNSEVNTKSLDNVNPEEQVLANASAGSRELYKLFKKSIEEGIFLEPTQACANTYYNQLKKDPVFAPLYTAMQGDFAAALNDEVQQALNAILESDPYEINNLIYYPERYAVYPEYLQKSIDLLGEDHYSIPALKAKKNFFEAVNKQNVLGDKDNTSKETRDSLNHLALALLNEAITLQPEASYLYYGKANFYTGHIPSKIDSIVFYSNKAVSFSPKWLLPYLTVASEYFYQLHDYTKAEEWLQKAYQINPESYIVLERLCWLYQNLDRPDQAFELAEKMLELRPDLFNSYGNMGGVNLMVKNYSEAEKYYKKSIEIENSPNSFAPLFLGQIYFATRRQDLGIEHYDKLIADERTPRWMKGYYYSWKGVALVNFTTRLDEAVQPLEESIERMGLPSQKAEAYVLMAKAKVLQKQWQAADLLLEKAFSHDTTSGPIILGYALKAEIKNQAGQIEEAESWFKKSLALTSGIYIFDLNYREKALFRYASFLLKQNRLEEAEQMFQEVIKYTHENGYYGYYGLALLALKKEDEAGMYEQLEVALDKWLPIPELLLEEPLLEEIVKTERFKKLLKNIFLNTKKMSKKKDK